jgi:multidrug resistance efflux pump
MIDDGQRELVLAVHVADPSGMADMPLKLVLAAFQGVPQVYEVVRKLRGVERDNARMVQAIELLGRVIESESFDRAALSLSNELAQIFGCEVVSLSWIGSAGLQLRAISQAEKLERQTELTDLLQEAGQEALAQGCEIVWPQPGKAVTRAHQHYAQLRGPGHLLTLPLKQSALQLGAITLERQRMAFSAAELWAVRLACDVVLPSLIALESRSRPLWRRLADAVWHSIPRRFKTETLDGRRLAFALALGLVALSLVPLPYSIDASAIVKTDAMAYVGAPFDGYLEKNHTSLGMPVKAGDVLFELATRELNLERAGILADIAQYAREAEKRRTANQLPEMLIAEAQANQAGARLKQIDYRLSIAQATSPINGVLVEGEPGKNLGGAVRRGDTIVKVAAIHGLYVEAAVDERDVGRVEAEKSVRFTLLADTGKTYSMKVVRVVPAASVKEGANTFPVRIEMQGLPPEWWRPGMSGVSKIYVGWRPLLWIASHRMLDYLKLLLWF